jgi:hypothetical protein
MEVVGVTGEWCGHLGRQNPRDAKMGDKVNIVNGII